MTAAAKNAVALVGESLMIGVVRIGAVTATSEATNAFFGDFATYYDWRIVGESLLYKGELFGNIIDGFGAVNVIKKGGGDF